MAVLGRDDRVWTLEGDPNPTVLAGPAVYRGTVVRVVPEAEVERLRERTLAEVRSLIAAVEDVNDIGPHGNGYRNAVAEVRRQLDLRFGETPDA